MKICASIRFGGQLIEATDCDYDSYQKYGTICPECKNSVFLVKATARTIGDKSIDVAAHFSHFKANKELGQTCELRINNYTQIEIEKAKSIARNQRFKFFQTWFWDCVLSSRVMQDPDRQIRDIVDLHHDIYRTEAFYSQGIDRLYNGVKSYLKDKKYQALHIARCLKSIETGEFDLKLTEDDKLPEHCQELIAQLQSSLDFKMHELICSEAIDFALTPRNRPLATALIFNSYVSISNRAENLEAGFIMNAETMKCHIDNFVGLICFVPWTERFENRNLETKS